MTKLEKVIKGLECCTTIGEDGFPICDECPYFCDESCPNLDEMHMDALELLKEQEPIKPTVNVDTWVCSKCGHELESQKLFDDGENPQILLNEQYAFCPSCGREVKWE